MSLRRGGRRELHRVRIKEQTDQVWHCYLPEARPGLIYGYRVHGPYDPNHGHALQSHKLLARSLCQADRQHLRWSDSHFGYRIGHKNADLSFDRRDSAAGMMKGVVIDSAFTWGTDRSPRIPWHQSVIYEVHVQRDSPFCTRNVPAKLRRHLCRTGHRSGNRLSAKAGSHRG